MTSHGALEMLDGVSDTGPLIHLDEIQQLEIIPQLFNQVFIPDYVIREISNQTVHSFTQKNPDTFVIEPIQEEALFTAKDTFSSYRLHLADLAVIISLANHSEAVAITDDLELRKAVESSGRIAVGSVGLFFRAYKLGILSKDQLRTVVGLLFNDSTLYLSSAFRSSVLMMIDSIL